MRVTRKPLLRINMHTNKKQKRNEKRTGSVCRTDAAIGEAGGDAILLGLQNKCILANKHEYFLVDYYKEEDFCEQYKLKATYSVDDFIQGIKGLKGEIK